MMPATSPYPVEANGPDRWGITIICTLALASVACLFASLALAAPASQEPVKIDWLELGMGLFGGLALFLAGLEVLSNGLKQAAGGTLQTVLEKLTVNRFMGAITGAAITGILNSSSVTTVLVVGFVTAGVMTLAQSVGVIMGANIGSTVTAQLLAFNISAYALIPVAAGFFMMFTGKTERARQIGMILMGLGLVFYGMGLMSEGMNPLRSYEPFTNILAKMERPLLGILAGAVFTGLVQSSAATVGIAIAMASEGLLTLPAGIALALGANIGTCVTALLAAMGKPVEAVRTAMVHVAFNVLGVLVWLPFITLLGKMAAAISPSATGLEGVALLAAEVPRQIANANTLFNVINTLLFIGFTAWFARLAERLVPDREPTTGVIITPQFLDEGALQLPTVALENARREIKRTGMIALDMMESLRVAMQQKDSSKVDDANRLEDEVDLLSASILQYLAKVRQSMLTSEESSTQETLTKAINNIESLADVMEKDMIGTVKTFLGGDFQPSSDETRDMVKGLWDGVHDAIEKAVNAVGSNDLQAARDVALMQERIEELADQLFQRLTRRLRSDDPKYLERVRLLMSFIEQLRHMYIFARLISNAMLPPELREQPA
jgi:phosphate:Na+ symporter